MRFLIRTILLTVAIFGAAHFIPEISIQSIWTALILVVVLGILNLTLKPLLVFFTIPVTILTLGLFLFVINTFIVLLADWMIKGFEVKDFKWAFIFALLLSLFHFLIDRIVSKK